MLTVCRALALQDMLTAPQAPVWLTLFIIFYLFEIRLKSHEK